jgi:hypothetical protein
MSRLSTSRRPLARPRSAPKRAITERTHNRPCLQQSPCARPRPTIFSRAKRDSKTKPLSASPSTKPAEKRSHRTHYRTHYEPTAPPFVSPAKIHPKALRFLIASAGAVVPGRTVVKEMERSRTRRVTMGPMPGSLEGWTFRTCGRPVRAGSFRDCRTATSIKESAHVCTR